MGVLMKFFSDVPDNLREIAPQGLAIGIGSFRTGEIEVHTNYSKDWRSLYDSRGWLVDDPAVRAGLAGLGCSSWDSASIVNPDFKEACRDFGLKSGISVTSEIGGSLCLVGMTTNRSLSVAAIEEATRAVRQAQMTPPPPPPPPPLYQLPPPPPPPPNHHTLSLHDALPISQLSPQHIEVVYLAANGYRAKEVANKLYLSEETVKQRKAAIQRQIGVNNFLAAVNVCAIAGLTLHPIK